MLRAFRAAVVPLGMPVIIFGGILGGVTTATEAAVLAVVYGFIVAVFIYREVSYAEVGRMPAATSGLSMRSFSRSVKYG